MSNHLSRREDFSRWVIFVGTALAVLLVYYPVLFFPPRADQVAYLAEIAHESHPSNLIFKYYDFNRHLVYGSGATDELLFRPLLFILIGVEQILFGHHFWAWQFVNLIAHLILVWFLLRLLWRLVGGWLALAGTWLFALSLANYELVTWTHLTGYLIMMIALVLAIEQLVICCQKEDLPKPQLWKMLIYFFISCFMYETVNIFVIWITLVLLIFFPKMRFRALALSIPVILYALCSWYNYTFVNHLPSKVISHGVSIMSSITNIFTISLWWLYEGVFCGMYHYITGLRTMFDANEVLVFKSLDINDLQVVMGLFILSMYMLLITLNRHKMVARLKLFLILVGMLVIYVGVIVIGREGNIIKDVVRINTYYMYMFWLLALIAAFVLLGSDYKTQFKRHLVFVFLMASLLSGIWQGLKIYQMTTTYANNTNKTSVLIKTIDLLIQEKGNEKDFSFYVHPQYAGNYLWPDFRKSKDLNNKEYNLIEILYPQYIRPREEAKYKFLIDESRLNNE